MTILEGSVNCTSSARWMVCTPMINSAKLNGESRQRGEVSAAEIKAAKERARAMLQRLARSLSQSGVPNF